MQQLASEQNQRTSLRITEIFHSIQGETTFSGLPTVFVRLTGCPLRCSYCDTAYAFHGGEKQSLVSIIQQVNDYHCQHVTVTGGEPLAQNNCIMLLEQLAEQGKIISLETSGALSIAKVPPTTHIILDLKTPSSKESRRNDWGNIKRLKMTDQIKFVIGNRNDYEWSKSKVIEYNLESKVETILFSPVHNVADLDGLSSTALAQWILDDNLNVRLQLQLHKYLWADEPGR